MFGWCLRAAPVMNGAVLERVWEHLRPQMAEALGISEDELSSLPLEVRHYKAFGDYGLEATVVKDGQTSSYRCLSGELTEQPSSPSAQPASAGPRPTPGEGSQAGSQE